MSSGLDATATMAPAGAACIRRARIETTLIATGRSKTPATVAATSSPMLCPASAAGVTPYDMTNCASAYSTANRAGWARSVGSRPAPSNTSANRSMPSSWANPAAHRSRLSRNTGSVS